MDQGTQFMSDLFKKLADLFNIELSYTSAYHPQGNGKVERFNKFLKNTLGTVISTSMKDWDEMLDNVLFVYRINYNRTLEDSPFYLMYGRDAQLPQDLLVGIRNTTKKYGDLEQFKLERLAKIKKKYDRVIASRAQDQHQYKSYYDRSHKHVEFKEGALVWIHFHLQEANKTHKLLPRFEGPYKVIKKIDQVTYRVQNDRRNFMVHVQRMLPYYEWENAED